MGFHFFLNVFYNFRTKIRPQIQTTSIALTLLGIFVESSLLRPKHVASKILTLVIHITCCDGRIFPYNFGHHKSHVE